MTTCQSGGYMITHRLYGFSGIPNIKYYYVFLFLLFIVSALGNTVVMIIICLDHTLRTPKYIAVFNLAFTDLFGSSALLPKVLDIFLFDHPYISYNDCLTFLFFYYTCFVMQPLNLVALAYDRMIAIIFPLHYHVKVTHRFMFSLIAFFWLFAVTVTLTAVGLLTRHSYCKSVVINSYFCDYGQIYRLACDDITPSFIYSALLTVPILGLPLVFIMFTYIYIGYALTKVATLKSHLSLVAIFFFPFIIAITSTGVINPNARIINLSLTSAFPPSLNPIIYVLQTKEIKESCFFQFYVFCINCIKVKQALLILEL
uniref:G-protein coupled receptors family 1 profile domain-containing protein n=1 Tax=Monopterus albus TaxID=43700 RepID=A0A3Q3IA28_MONAL